MKSNLQVEKVIEWNKKRYDQVFSYDLSNDLIIEELNELYSSVSLVETLDAIGDISFVVIGCMWKMGISKDHICSVIDNNISIDEFILNTQVENNFTAKETLTLKRGLDCMLITCPIFLNMIGILDKHMEVLDIICNSNNTKSLPKDKVDPSVKANIDKGSTFVPPTEDLQKLLEDKYGQN